MARAPKKVEVEVAPFTIIVDTREQQPLTFGRMVQPDGKVIEVPSVVATLKTGDYSIVSHDKPLPNRSGGITIERKSIVDLVNTIISNRDRFIRELERMSAYKFAAIVIEGSMRDVRDYLPEVGHPKWAHMSEAQIRSHPRAVIKSLERWAIRYGVHIRYVDKDREFCRRTVYRICECFYEESRLATLGIGRGAERATKVEPAASGEQQAMFDGAGAA